MILFFLFSVIRKLSDKKSNFLYFKVKKSLGYLYLSLNTSFNF